MEKINLISKKIMILTLIFCSFVGIINVKADSVPETITIKEKKDMVYLTGVDAYIDNHSTYMKTLTDGTLAYCSGSSKQKAPGGETLKLVGEADAGLTYILKNGYPNKSFIGDYKKDYYITQAAIWEYFDRTRGSNNWANVNFENAAAGSMHYYVDMLVDGAVNALKNTNPNAKPTIDVTIESNKLNLETDYYVSALITVKASNTDGTYTVDLNSLPKGSIVKDANGNVKTTFKTSEKFRIFVPKSETLETISVKVTSKKTVYKSYDYRANDNQYYQNILVTTLHKNVINVSDTLTFDYENTFVRISKQDITNKKELPGATLVVKDSTGKVIDSWVSTNEKHYMDLLPVGKYTLEETIAPEGYVLSTEKIEFEVKKDGRVETVVMYNTPKKNTVVKISKQDITNKAELPGATLVVKDSNGKVIEEWVSTNEPHYISNLSVGKYTLTETIAPEGYVLSSETIEFEVKRDGSVKAVIMYNTLKDKTVIKISKQDITSKEELPGATLVVKDSTGKVIEEWVSTNEPHLMDKLEVGKYTLTETIAPEGYALSTETIEFEVKHDGSIQTVVMYNTLKDKTVIKISKQDITNKAELPGATLVVKDSEGNIIDEWVSTNEPHLMDKLEVGKYTLTETIAPNGYELSIETIEFEVKRDGGIQTVVMYNAPSIEVPKTDLNVSLIVIISGMLLSMFGVGIVFKYSKN